MERVFIKPYRGRQPGDRLDLPITTWGTFYPKWRKVTQDAAEYDEATTKELAALRKKAAGNRAA